MKEQNAKVKITSERDYIGFATLPEQVHRKSVKKGFDFTLMVVGEAGLGKSTMVNSLFLTDLYKDRKIPNVEERVEKTTSIERKTMEIEEKGVRLRLTIVDTPDDCRKSLKEVTLKNLVYHTGDYPFRSSYCVYTVNDESKCLLAHGVPSVGLMVEMERLCKKYGQLDHISVIHDFPSDEFTEVYYVKYQRIQSGRFAKHHLDNKSFFGGMLHVCYAPELETLKDTREKLQERRKAIAARTRYKDRSISQTQAVTENRCYKKKQSIDPGCSNPPLRTHGSQVSSASCIWQGCIKEQDPRLLSDVQPEPIYGPLLPDETRRQLVTSVVGQQNQNESDSSHYLGNESKGGNLSTKNNQKQETSATLFIPRQVLIKKRIVFHGTRSEIMLKQRTKDRVSTIADQNPDQLKESHLKDMPTEPKIQNEDYSVEGTVHHIREKVKAVGLPNPKIIIKRQKKQ